ncbi:hypothetical protein C3B59_18245 [Cryobacterium zongtaii]|uniref:Uncharacterized protein n=1 Tax=Cryobacterium zongtaii TaxID=1259217 RepID=A0A2S3Z5G9_9MICO|nr:hypothetical protein C3B59_18245 [Cryobacterium zongtaii]
MGRRNGRLGRLLHTGLLLNVRLLDGGLLNGVGLLLDVGLHLWCAGLLPLGHGHGLRWWGTDRCLGLNRLGFWINQGLRTTPCTRTCGQTNRKSHR